MGIIYPNVMAELARHSLSVTTLSEYMGRTRQNVDNKLRGKNPMTHNDMKKIQAFILENGGEVLTLDYLFKTKADL